MFWLVWWLPGIPLMLFFMLFLFKVNRRPIKTLDLVVVGLLSLVPIINLIIVGVCIIGVLIMWIEGDLQKAFLMKSKWNKEWFK